MSKSIQVPLSKSLLILCLVMGFAAIAAADSAVVTSQPQAESIAVVTSEPQEADAEDSKKVLSTLEQRMEKRISVDFRETPIDDVLRIMAEQADVDIVKSPKVIGNVTATLTNVPLQEALANILAAHGFGYVASNNMIRIAPSEELIAVAEKLENRIYRITYADVKEVESSLTKFLSARGSIASNQGTSNLIITDTESKIKAIDAFIDEIDRITPQILVEVRIYDITTTDTLDLGIEWNAGRNTTLTSGIGNNPTAGRTDPFLTGLFEGKTSETASTDGLIRFGWLNSSIDIDVILRAQAESVNAKLLANPRILVLDNEEALFDIVREIPYQETSTTGNTATETIKFKNVGVKLEVTPHITREGMLRLKISPEFGVVVGQDDNTDVVIVDTRKLTTTTLAKDGQTIVMAGMRKKDVSQQINKIPILGDIPLLGGLFRFEGEDTATTELVVFITPRIIEQPSLMSRAEQDAYIETNIPRPELRYTKTEIEAKELDEEEVVEDEVVEIDEDEDEDF